MSNNNSGASSGYRIVCFCGAAAVMRTSWTEKNPGRRFHGCALHQENGGCNFFAWYDSPICDRGKEVINSLKGKLQKREEELQKREEDFQKECAMEIDRLKHQLRSKEKKVRRMENELARYRPRSWGYKFGLFVCGMVVCIAIVIGVQKSNGDNSKSISRLPSP